ICHQFLPRRHAPPHISTLFPYTTLFRSHLERQAFSRRRPGGQSRVGVWLAAGEFPRNPGRRRPGVLHRRKSRCESVSHNSTAQRDRKSTRLNSSHVSISYAVFCLKEKR